MYDQRGLRQGAAPPHRAPGQETCTTSPNQHFSPGTGLPPHPPPNGLPTHPPPNGLPTHPPPNELPGQPPPNPPAAPQHYRLEDMALAHHYRDTYRHNEHRDTRERTPQTAVHGGTPGRSHRPQAHGPRVGTEEWKHLDNVRTSIPHPPGTETSQHKTGILAAGSHVFTKALPLSSPLSPQSCWELWAQGPARRVAAGNTARYCGSFCQHKDWEKHPPRVWQGPAGPPGKQRCPAGHPLLLRHLSQPRSAPLPRLRAPPRAPSLWWVRAPCRPSPSAPREQLQRRLTIHDPRDPRTARRRLTLTPSYSPSPSRPRTLTAIPADPPHCVPL
ncbi:unnamed protein product [Arctogadus glacialis]